VRVRFDNVDQLSQRQESTNPALEMCAELLVMPRPEAATRTLLATEPTLAQGTSANGARFDTENLWSQGLCLLAAGIG